MSRTDTVGASVATADDQHILALGIDELIFRKLLTGEDAVLLGEHLECEVNTLQVASGYLQVAGLRRTGADDHGVVVLRQLAGRNFLVLA